MAKQKKEKTYEIKRKNSKSGKSIKVTESQINNLQNTAKKAVKKVKKKHRWVAITAILAICLAFTLFFDASIMGIEYLPTLINKSQYDEKYIGKGENELKTHFIDVGQGDCIFLQLPDNTNMLIDAGDNKSDNYLHAISYIKYTLKVKTIDYLMLTHTDLDHVGGMKGILENFDIKKVYMPYVEENLTVTKTYSSFLKLVQKEKAEIEISNAGDQIVSKDTKNEFILAFLSPEEPDIEDIDGDGIKGDGIDGEYEELNNGLKAGKSNLAEEKNNVSPIVLLDYLNVKFLFTGDAHQKVEKNVIKKFSDSLWASKSSFTINGVDYFVNLKDVDLLKVGHHGSKESSCDEFLSVISPLYSVISVAEVNSHGHPTKEALARLGKYVEQDKMYMTKDNGDIVATISPKTSGEKGDLKIVGSKNIEKSVVATKQIDTKCKINIDKESIINKVDEITINSKIIAIKNLENLKNNKMTTIKAFDKICNTVYTKNKYLLSA